MRAKLEVRSRKHPQITQIISGRNPDYPNYDAGVAEAKSGLDISLIRASLTSAVPV